MDSRRRSFLFAAAALASGAAPARSLDAIRKSGKLVAATEGAFAPFNYFDGSRLTGFEVDLAGMLARQMGLSIEWKTVGFDALLTGLAQDRWDLVIASHGITDERAKAVTFMAPHYCSGGVIVARDESIKSTTDLAGRTVAVQTGTTYLENVQKVPGVKSVRNFPSDADARSALAAGRVHAWVTDRFTAMESARRNPQLKLHVGDLFFTERIAAAAAKGNTSLSGAWNEALSKSMADGSYAALSKKYFGEDVRCR